MGKCLPERAAGVKSDQKGSLEIVRSASTALITFWRSISRMSDSKWKGKQCRMTHAWWRAWSSPRRRLRFAVPFSLATSNASFSFSTWVDRCPPPVSILPTDAQANQSRLRFLSTAFQPGNKTNFTEILATITQFCLKNKQYLWLVQRQALLRF